VIVGSDARNVLTNYDTWKLTVYLDFWNEYNRSNVMAYSYKVDTNGIGNTTSRLDFEIVQIVGVTAQF
jgi:hypothetical protein